MTCPGMSRFVSWYRDTETPRYVVARSRSRYGADKSHPEAKQRTRPRPPRRSQYAQPPLVVSVFRGRVTNPLKLRDMNPAPSRWKPERVVITAPGGWPVHRVWVPRWLLLRIMRSWSRYPSSESALERAARELADRDGLDAQEVLVAARKIIDRASAQ